MQVHTNLALLPKFNNAVITTGTFDGIHIAHQEIIHRVIRCAKELNGESVLITFHPHPQFILNDKPGTIQLISTLTEKIELLKPLGIDHLVIVPFSHEFAKLTAHDYILNFLVHYFHPIAIIIGYNHRFGFQRLGDVTLLKQYGITNHFTVIEIEKQLEDQIAISSTRIRKTLLSGHPEEACNLLGRNYSFKGKVITGRQLGRTIGFPTANIQPEDPNQLIPAVGVYSVYITIQNTQYKGMMNIGVRPTIDNSNNLVIEVHVFDFNETIYDLTVEVFIQNFVRPEQKFNSKNELIEQLQADKKKVLSLLIES